MNGRPPLINSPLPREGSHPVASIEDHPKYKAVLKTYRIIRHSYSTSQDRISCIAKKVGVSEEVVAAIIEDNYGFIP